MVDFIGKIVRLDNSGLGVVLEEGKDGFLRPFGLDKIANYRGESIKELKNKGLAVGSIIRFKLDERFRIINVQPLFFKQN